MSMRFVPCRQGNCWSTDGDGKPLPIPPICPVFPGEPGVKPACLPCLGGRHRVQWSWDGSGLPTSTPGTLPFSSCHCLTVCPVAVGLAVRAVSVMAYDRMKASSGRKPLDDDERIGPE